MPKRVGQDPFKSALASSDRSQRRYAERARNPELFKGNTREKQQQVTERVVRGFRENLQAVERRNMGE